MQPSSVSENFKKSNIVQPNPTSMESDKMEDDFQKF